MTIKDVFDRQIRNHAYKACAALITASTIAAGAAALRADSGPCTYGLPSVTAEVPAAGGTVSIALVTQSGCAWTASTDSTAVMTLTPADGSGSATVQVTVAPNPDPEPRLVNVTLGDAAVGTKLYMVNQLGSACTFAIAAPPPVVAAAGGAGTFNIATQSGCGWSVSAADSFVSFNTSSGVADSRGLATIAYTVDPNSGSDTRRSSITVTNPGLSVNAAYTAIAQGGVASGSVSPWHVGDVIAGIGSWFSNGGIYRALNADGSPATAPDLHDAWGGTTTACAIDPTVVHGDLFTTSWDGLLVSRFSDTTHQLVSALDLSPAGLATVQRSTGTVPVPYTQNLNIGVPWPDFTYSEQLVFDQNGNFYVGGSMYVAEDLGLGHAYLLKFAKNDDGSVPGCPAASPCLLDWWRVDAAGETPAGQDPAGSNARWTSLYKTAYTSASGDVPARTAAAFAAVAPLAASLSYAAGTAPQMPGPAGVDELDLSSDQHTVFYTSEDNRIRRFDTATGQQLTPLTITDPDTHQPYHGKAYGFRLLPDGSGHADGSAGLVVAMSIGVFRLDASGSAIKPAGLNDIVQYQVDPGVSHPFAMNLTPDAQSLWVATSQEDSSQPTLTGGKIYRFHIPTGKRDGPFNVGAEGADVDIQGLCVKREFTAGVNQCFQTDKDGKGVLDENGNPIAIACKNPPICSSLGIDANGRPNVDCYPPGEVPLTLPDRSSFEGDRPGSDGASDLDLRPLTAGHDITALTNLPADLRTVADPATGYIIGVTGTVSWSTCPKELQDPTLLSDPVNVCKSYAVGVRAADGATTSFVWNVHFKDAPPSISSHDTMIRASSALALPTPAADADTDEALVARLTATALDTTTNTQVPVSLADYGVQLSSGRMFPSAAGALAVQGFPTGYPHGAPRYPTVFTVTIDVHDCNNQLADSFTASTNLDTTCFHHVSTTFRLTVVNDLPRFVSGFGSAPAFAPLFINSGVDQFSLAGQSLASGGGEYQLIAEAPAARLPLAFSFTCASASGVLNAPGCDPTTGLPAGLSYRYATATSGVFASSPDPSNASRTNQYVIIGGTPTQAANDLLITATLTDPTGAHNPDPFTFHWTVHGAPRLTLANQTTFSTDPSVYTFAPGTSPNGYYPLTYAASGLPPFLIFNPSTRTFSPSGTPPTAGTYGPITVTVTDTPPPGRAPSAGQAQFFWTVTANRPPLCSGVTPSQALWPPNHKFVGVTVNGVSDPDGDPVTIAVTSIWQDEPLSTEGSGHTVVADASGVGTPVASVRAERAAVKATPGAGRIYQVNFNADDGRGGSCSGAIYVGVPHDQGQMRMPIDSGARYDSLTGARIR